MGRHVFSNANKTMSASLEKLPERAKRTELGQEVPSCAPPFPCGEDLAASAAARDAMHQSGSCAGGVKRGTSCTQQCKSDYEKESGDATRTCQMMARGRARRSPAKRSPLAARISRHQQLRGMQHQSGSCAGV